MEFSRWFLSDLNWSLTHCEKLGFFFANSQVVASRLTLIGLILSPSNVAKYYENHKSYVIPNYISNIATLRIANSKHKKLVHKVYSPTHHRNLLPPFCNCNKAFLFSNIFYKSIFFLLSFINHFLMEFHPNFRIIHLNIIHKSIHSSPSAIRISINDLYNFNCSKGNWLSSLKYILFFTLFMGFCSSILLGRNDLHINLCARIAKKGQFTFFTKVFIHLL